MFHGVMAALEFLVLSVPVRIGVEQHPIPRTLRLSPFYAGFFYLSSVYMTLLFFCLETGEEGHNKRRLLIAYYQQTPFTIYLLFQIIVKVARNAFV